MWTALVGEYPKMAPQIVYVRGMADLWLLLHPLPGVKQAESWQANFDAVFNDLLRVAPPDVNAALGGVRGLVDGYVWGLR